MLILLVEDDPDHARLITAGLRRDFGRGLRVEVAQSAEEALERLELGSPLDEPDILLVDHYLPGMSGLELLVRLREAQDDRPIVILTSCNDQQLALQALRCGASDFITKNGDMAQNLMGAVVRTMEHVRLQRELMATQERIAALEVPPLLVSAEARGRGGVATRVARETQARRLKDFTRQVSLNERELGLAEEGPLLWRSGERPGARGAGHAAGKAPSPGGVRRAGPYPRTRAGGEADEP